MAVCWAWARRGSTWGSLGGSTGDGSTRSEQSDGKSFGSAFRSTLTSSRGGDSWGSSGASSGASRPSRRRRAVESASASLRIWSRPTFLDDVITQLDERTSDRGVLIHVADLGITEHDGIAAAIKYLRSVLRDRRQPRLGDDGSMSSRSSTLSQPVRRRLRSAPVPLRVDEGVCDPSVAAEKNAEAADDSQNVASLAERKAEAEKKAEAADDSQKVGSLAENKVEEAVVPSGLAHSDADVHAPSHDGPKLVVDERLRDLQLVLDTAPAHEFVGLAVVLGGERGTVKMHCPDRGFLVALDSGAEVSLARIEASHIVDCLPEWAFGDA